MSSLKRQLFDFLNINIRCLLSCLDSNNTLAIKMLDGRHSASTGSIGQSIGLEVTSYAKFLVTIFKNPSKGFIFFLEF